MKNKNFRLGQSLSLGQFKVEFRIAILVKGVEKLSLS